ncbi:NPCBM/NEW2 domain-containing protein [Kineococcus arenarius]|uniref:NPCBM/NEW2 domain-containing protein n=1 Tax=Kineococcus sp. SYSU DK007 TaxID=3383128 RepID=UPI003D7D369F
MTFRLSRKFIAAQLPVAIAAALTCATVTAPSAQAASLPAVPAQMADSFVDSIGVATHLTYTGTPYMNYPLVKQRLQESGIRHLRDGWGTGSKYASDFVEKELSPMGVGITMVQDPRQNATPAQLKDMVKTQLPTAIDAVEGLNEWDLRGGNWAVDARNWTIQVAEAYRGDPATKNIPIVAPSLADTNATSKYQALGDISAYVDYGNTHDYPGNQYHMNDSIIDTVLRNNSVTAKGKKVYATETGFSTGTTSAPYRTMPAAQVAQALPNLYLDHFRRGVARTFSYELFDQHADNAFESKFGLLNNDGSPKASFNAMSNLINLLNDKGSAFSTKPLNYELQGTNAKTRTLLLQKRDGSYWLAVWQQDRLFDGNQVVNPADVPVTLKLGSPVSSVKLYDPVKNRSSFGGSSNTDTVKFSSTESVTLVELRGTGSSTTPTQPTPTPTPSTPTTTAPPATPSPSTSTSGSVRPVSGLPLTQVANAWGPAELNKSNGEGARGDGKTITVGGKTYTSGLGVHAGSEVRFTNDGATTFTAVVGLDAEVNGKGSVTFQVFGDGTKLYDSGKITGTTTKNVSANITGKKEIRLVVTDGGDGNAFDHADWADAKISTGASTPAPAVTRNVRPVSGLPLTQVANAWGPAELNKSNGEGARGDGKTITVGGKTYTSGLGVHAGSEVRFTNDGATTFTAVVGLDAEVNGKGSVTFQVFGDGTKLYDSGKITGTTTKNVSANITGKKEIRLVVTDGGDGNAFDHADWADAKIS